MTGGTVACKKYIETGLYIINYLIRSKASTDFSIHQAEASDDHQILIKCHKYIVSSKLGKSIEITQLLKFYNASR